MSASTRNPDVHAFRAKLQELIRLHPEHAVEAQAILDSVEHLDVLLELMPGMVANGCTADELKAFAFRQMALSAHEIRKWQREHEPARLAHDTQ